MKRRRRTTVWAYLDGKKLVDVVQAALDNNMMVDDMKALLIRENPSHIFLPAPAEYHPFVVFEDVLQHLQRVHSQNSGNGLLGKLHYRERLIQLDGGVNGDAVGHRHPTQRKYLGGSEQEPCYRLQDIGPGLSCPQFFHPFPQMPDSGRTEHDTQGSPHNQSGSGD